MKKKFSWIIILAIIVIFTISFSYIFLNSRYEGLSNENLIIVNNSTQKIYSFGFDQMNSLSGGCYADGTPIKKGESFGFKLDKLVGCEFVLTAKDKAGDEILRSDKFKVNFTEGKVTISIKEDGRGKLYTEIEK